MNVPAPGLLSSVSDPDGDPLTAVLVSGPSHGQLTLNSDGSFTYTPDAGYTGPDAFAYRASDGTALSNASTVSINVTGSSPSSVEVQIIAGPVDPRTTPIDVIDVVFSQPIDPTTFTVADITLTYNGRVVPLGPDVIVSVLDANNSMFRISGLDAHTMKTGYYVVTIDPQGIADAAGNPILNSTPISYEFRRGLLDGDYDGDDIADLATYRFDEATGTGIFEVLRSSDGVTDTFRIGGKGDIPVFGDFDGDGRTDPAVVQPEFDIDGDGVPDASRWVIFESGSNYNARFVLFGASGRLDRPAPADFDGDGVTDIATFRANSDLVPGAAQWFILPSATNSGYSVVFGAPGGVDLPAPADYDCDGRADIATFRPVSDLIPGAAQWFILPSGPNGDRYTTTNEGFPVVFGAAGNADQPVPADYNGDGRFDIAAFRSVSDLAPGSSQWFVLPSDGDAPNFASGFPLTFGLAGNIAAVTDYDRDGLPEYAIFDQTQGTWTIRHSKTNLEETVVFGQPGANTVPVLSPLFFRLVATGNPVSLEPSDVATATAARTAFSEDRGNRSEGWRRDPSADLVDQAIDDLMS